MEIAGQGLLIGWISLMSMHKFSGNRKCSQLILKELIHDTHFGST